MNDVDLSHWDFAESFRGEEVAPLILGFEPYSDFELSKIKTNLIYQRMFSAYDLALSRLWGIYRGAEKGFLEPLLVEGCLFSNGFEVIFPGFSVSDLEINSSPLKVSESFNNKSVEVLRQIGVMNYHSAYQARSDLYNHLKVDTFSRYEVGRWLLGGDLKSKYNFDSPMRPGKSIEKSSGHWPWGNHSTQLLEALEAAGKKFWVNHDPSDPSTAPKNKDVADFLKQRGVSGVLADAMATILRQDGLRTGPRK